VARAAVPHTGILRRYGKWEFRGREEQSPDQAQDLPEHPRYLLEVPKLDVLRDGMK
jgi:hypothetical protein